MKGARRFSAQIDDEVLEFFLRIKLLKAVRRFIPMVHFGTIEDDSKTSFTIFSHFNRQKCPEDSVFDAFCIITLQWQAKYMEVDENATGLLVVGYIPFGASGSSGNLFRYEGKSFQKRAGRILYFNSNRLDVLFANLAHVHGFCHNVRGKQKFLWIR